MTDRDFSADSYERHSQAYCQYAAGGARSATSKPGFVRELSIPGASSECTHVPPALEVSRSKLASVGDADVWMDAII